MIVLTDFFIGTPNFWVSFIERCRELLSLRSLIGSVIRPGRRWKKMQSKFCRCFTIFILIRSNTSETNPPSPLLKAAEPQLEAWQECRIPWQAGLPTFVRVTLYGSDGRSRGHIRDWSWNEICFQRALRPLGPVRFGTGLFAVDENFRLNLTPLQKGSLLAVRCADRELIAEALATVRRFGAEGVVYFRMPDGSDPSGWSLRQVGQILRGDPFTAKLSVHLSEGSNWSYRTFLTRIFLLVCWTKPERANGLMRWKSTPMHPSFAKRKQANSGEWRHTFHPTTIRARQAFRSPRDSLFGLVTCVPAKFCGPAWFNSRLA